MTTTTPAPRRRGRPPLPDARHERIMVRVTAEELELLERSAALVGVPVSTFIRLAVVEVCRAEA